MGIIKEEGMLTASHILINSEIEISYQINAEFFSTPCVPVLWFISQYTYICK